MKFKLQTIKDFFKLKEKKGLKPIFFEKIGDKNTSRDDLVKNLIMQLEANGFKIKNKKQRFDLSLNDLVYDLVYCLN